MQIKQRLGSTIGKRAYLPMNGAPLRSVHSVQPGIFVYEGIDSRRARMSDWQPWLVYRKLLPVRWWHLSSRQNFFINFGVVKWSVAAVKIFSRRVIAYFVLKLVLFSFFITYCRRSREIRGLKIGSIGSKHGFRSLLCGSTNPTRQWKERGQGSLHFSKIVQCRRWPSPCNTP